jgi:hypothetical protein
MPGVSARKTYQKFGFEDKELTTHDGLPRCKMVRPASAEKRGGSFHYRYPAFIKAAQKEICPVCNDEPAPYESYEEYLWFVEQMRKELT